MHQKVLLANQLAIYEHGKGFEFSTALNKSSYNLGQNKWKTLTPHPPKSKMGKWRVFAIQAASPLIWGGDGRLLFHFILPKIVAVRAGLNTQGLQIASPVLKPLSHAASSSGHLYYADNNDTPVIAALYRFHCRRHSSLKNPLSCTSCKAAVSWGLLCSNASLDCCLSFFSNAVTENKKMLRKIQCYLCSQYITGPDPDLKADCGEGLLMISGPNKKKTNL